MINFKPLNEVMFPASDFEIAWKMFEPTEWTNELKEMFKEFFETWIYHGKIPYSKIHLSFNDDDSNEIYNWFLDYSYNHYDGQYKYVSYLHIYRDLKAYVQIENLPYLIKLNRNTISIDKLTEGVYYTFV